MKNKVLNISSSKLCVRVFQTHVDRISSQFIYISGRQGYYCFHCQLSQDLPFPIHQIATLTSLATNYLTLGEDFERMGNEHPSLVPYQTFRTQDEQWLMIGAGNDRQFIDLCSVLDLPDLAKVSCILLLSIFFVSAIKSIYRECFY